jgi:hypothetical protein
LLFPLGSPTITLHAFLVIHVNSLWLTNFIIPDTNAVLFSER